MEIDFEDEIDIRAKEFKAIVVVAANAKGNAANLTVLLHGVQDFENLLQANSNANGISKGSSSRRNIYQSFSIIFSSILVAVSSVDGNLMHHLWLHCLKLLRIVIAMDPQDFLQSWQQFLSESGRIDTAIASECCTLNILSMESKANATATEAKFHISFQSPLFSASFTSPNNDIRVEALRCISAAVSGLPLQHWFIGLSRNVDLEISPSRKPPSSRQQQHPIGKGKPGAIRPPSLADKVRCWKWMFVCEIY